MTESMAISRNAAASDQTAKTPSQERLPLWLLAIPAAVMCFLIFPHVYGRAAFGPQYMRAFPGPYFDYVLLGCAANFAVILASAHLKGRFDRKLAAVLTRIFLIHGTLAFSILLLHLPYSNQIMIGGAITSVIIGSLYMYIEHIAVQDQIAVIGHKTPAFTRLCENYRGSVWVLEDPMVDVRDFDLVLTPGMTELTPEWALFVSRAMLSGVPVRHIAEFLEEADGIVSIEHFDLDHLPLGGLTSYRLRKRILDVALIIITAPITLTLAAAGALAVLCMSGRPVMFVQDRTGVSGESFPMFKLRTMRPVDANDIQQATSKGDTRVTSEGAWLRRFRIDELPQLWNVLKGDMSIIGPRPEWTTLSDEYQKQFPAYAYRHLVRPGITGWAQVRSGYAADLDETKVKVGYDLFYIKNLSFSLDVQILLRTIMTLVTGKGAR